MLPAMAFAPILADAQCLASQGCHSYGGPVAWGIVLGVFAVTLLGFLAARLTQRARARHRGKPTSDPGLADAQGAGAAARPGVFVMGSEGELTPISAPPAEGHDAAQELQKLVELRDRGALTEGELDALRSKLR